MATIEYEAFEPDLSEYYAQDCSVAYAIMFNGGVCNEELHNDAD